MEDSESDFLAISFIISSPALAVIYSNCDVNRQCRGEEMNEMQEMILGTHLQKGKETYGRAGSVFTVNQEHSPAIGFFPLEV